jgi:hypothetical protein
LDGGAITGAFCFGEHAIKEVTDFVTGVQRDSKNRFSEISDRLYSFYSVDCPQTKKATPKLAQRCQAV